VARAGASNWRHAQTLPEEVAMPAGKWTGPHPLYRAQSSLALNPVNRH
jgi:hypothetical protein